MALALLKLAVIAVLPFASELIDTVEPDVIVPDVTTSEKYIRLDAYGILKLS